MTKYIKVYTSDRTHDIAEYAAHMMDGLVQADLHKVQQVWHHGFLELVSDLSDLALVLDEIIQRITVAAKGNVDHPGVFVYEVPGEIGKWVGEQIILNGGTFPERCTHHMVDCVKSFFAQAKDSEFDTIVAKALEPLLQPQTSEQQFIRGCLRVQQSEFGTRSNHLSHGTQIVMDSGVIWRIRAKNGGFSLINENRKEICWQHESGDYIAVLVNCQR